MPRTPHASCCPPSTACTRPAASALVRGTSWTSCGKKTDKVAQFGHDKLSTFGIGAVDRAATARRAAPADCHRRGGPAKVMLDSGMSFDTLCLTDGSRAVLKGEVPVQLRESVSAAAPKRTRKSSAPSRRRQPGARRAGALHQPQGLARRRWPANTTCPPTSSSTMPRWQPLPSAQPASLDDLQGISGMGAKKLEAYGSEVLRVCAAAGPMKQAPTMKRGAANAAPLRLKTRR